MKKSILGVLLILLFLLPAWTANKIYRLGVHPFYKTKKPVTAEELAKITEELAGQIKIGFEQAGYGDVVFAFLEQIKQAKIEETQIQPGDTFLWMLFRTRRKVKVVTDAVWAGRKPVDAFKVTIYRDLKAYEFVIPKICLNIALTKVEQLPAPVCDLKVTPTRVEIGKPVKIDVCGSKNAVKNVVTIKDAAGNVIKTLELTPSNCTTEYVFSKPGKYTVINVAEEAHGFHSTNVCEVVMDVWENKPPVCNLKVYPETALTNQEITLDASASHDPDGQIVAAEFTIKDEAGNVVEKKVVTEKPFVYKFKYGKAGSYSVALVVKDNGGKVSSPACEGKLVIKKRGFFIADVGYLRQEDPREFIPIRIGYQYKITDIFRISAAGGAAITLSDSDYGTPIIADLTLLYYPSRFFLGAGVGLWYVEDDTKADLVVNTGFDLVKTEKLSGALFIEGRVGFNEFDQISDLGRIGVGFRLSF